MFQSLRRGFPRIFVLAMFGFLILWATRDDDLALIFGPAMNPIMEGFGRVLLAFGFGDLVLRILQPSVDAQEAAKHAMYDRNLAAGYVYLGRSLLAAVVLLLFAGASHSSQEPPTAAQAWLPFLKLEQATYWRDHPQPSLLGAQVEQETCPSLKHWMCWNPKAQLLTKRERGVNLGQFTKAWDAATGLVRFDALTEIVQAYPKELSGFSWQNPYDGRLGLRALVLKDKQIYDRIKEAETPLDQYKMMLSAYNGGEGGLRKDRSICRGTPGCNPNRWDGHVALTSNKSKVKVPGYGLPFFYINREYAANITGPRQARYRVLDLA